VTCRDAASAVVVSVTENGRWVHPARRCPGYLAEGKRFEGQRTPGALPVRNKTGAGSKGASRREGHETLRAERSGLVCPRQVDPRS
jgi:hypothetical protein